MLSNLDPFKMQMSSLTCQLVSKVMTLFPMAW